MKIEQEIMEMFDKEFVGELMYLHTEDGFEFTQTKMNDSVKSFISHIITIVQKRKEEEMVEVVETILSKVQEDVDFGAKHQQLVQTKAQAHCFTILSKLKTYKQNEK